VDGQKQEYLESKSTPDKYFAVQASNRQRERQVKKKTHSWQKENDSRIFMLAEKANEVRPVRTAGVLVEVLEYFLVLIQLVKYSRLRSLDLWILICFDRHSVFGHDCKFQMSPRN